MPIERLDMIPDSSDIYVWADYFELRALAHPDKCYTRGEFSILCQQLSGTGQKAPRDPHETWREVKEFIRNRSIIYVGAYPLKIGGRDEDVFELPRRVFTKQENLYLTLLICSSLSYVTRAGGHVQKLGRLFEECSLQVFKRIMPSGAEVHAAWAAAGAAARYKGTLPNKLRAIAADIRAVPNFDDDDFDPNDYGDGGIDMVAWHALGDDRVAIPSALAQCGCSREEWRTKHIAASPVMLRNKLNPTHPWATYYFMPIDLRKSDGKWAHKSDFGDAILIDRLRMINLSKEHKLASHMPLHNYVSEVANLNFM